MFRVLIIVIVATVVHGMKDLVATTSANTNTTMLSSYITQSGVTSELQATGPFTFLVPVDAAFNNLGAGELAKLTSDNGKLADMIRYHTLLGEVFSYEAANGLILNSISGHAIRVYTKGKDIYFNNAKAIKMDLEADNGVIYLIDTVLDVPEGTVYQILEKPEYSTTEFKNLVDQVHYDRMLNYTYTSSSYRYTVFVPTDAAFAKLPTSALDKIKQSSTYRSELVRYHIHRGTIHVKSLDHDGKMTTLYSGHNIGVDTSNNDIRLNHIAHLTKADIEADNGVVHLIDHVLLPTTLIGVVG